MQWREKFSAKLTVQLVCSALQSSLPLMCVSANICAVGRFFVHSRAPRFVHSRAHPPGIIQKFHIRRTRAGDESSKHSRASSKLKFSTLDDSQVPRPLPPSSSTGPALARKPARALASHRFSIKSQARAHGIMSNKFSAFAPPPRRVIFHLSSSPRSAAFSRNGTNEK